MAFAAVRGESVDLGQVSQRSWLTLGYLIVFGSLVAFTAYSWLLGNAPISLVGTYAYVNPAVAVLLGALVLNEAVTWPMLAGGLVIVVGVGIVVSSKRRTAPASRPQPRPWPKTLIGSRGDRPE